MSENIRNIPGTDHIDPEWAMQDMAKKLGIPVSMMPKEMKDSLKFICTSDEPR